MKHSSRLPAQLVTLLLWNLAIFSTHLQAQDPNQKAPSEEAATAPAPDAATAPAATTANAPSSAANASVSDRRLRPKQLLAEALADESHWLDTSEGKILVLYRPTQARVTKGALLLLHAAEDPQSWPPELENLRQNLPLHGWETLAVTLPQAYPPTPPEREITSAATTAEAVAEGEAASQDPTATPAPTAAPPETTTPVEPPPAEASPAEASASSSQASRPTPIAREQLIKAYLLAALAFLNEKGQFNLVVLVDNSSLYWIMQLLSPSIKPNRLDPNTVDGPLQALVITNLQAQEPLSKAELEASLNQAQLPVMDIFFAPADIQQKIQRKHHKAAAMRNKLGYYQQVQLDNHPKVVEEDQASFLLARVRGFMEKKARGTEIKSTKQNGAP